MKNNILKKAVPAVLSLAMAFSVINASAAPVAAAAKFTDVPEKAWYYSDVYKAVDMGLVNGKTDTTFVPDADLTYAEVVKLAACMHQKYMTGSVNLQNGSPWYQTYVDYCSTNNIISKDYDWKATATRAGYMEIFANSLPDSALKAVNTIEDGAIPDVDMKHPAAAAIYKLYRAGIVNGMDEAHNCKPESSIKRREVATILARMMDDSVRKTFEMEAGMSGNLEITKQPQQIKLALKESGTISVTVVGGSAPYTYRWECEDGNGIWAVIPDGEFATTSVSSDTVKFTMAEEKSWITEFKVRCTVTDSKGKTVTTTPIVPVKAVPAEGE